MGNYREIYNRENIGKVVESDDHPLELAVA